MPDDVDVRRIMLDVYSYFADERVNVELLFDEDEETGLLITVRVRPWKGTRNGDRMVLAGGRTVNEALFHAAKAALAQQWIDLDWRKRALTVGAVLQKARPTQLAFATERAERLPEALFGADLGNTPPEDVFEAENGSESVAQIAKRLKGRQAKP